MTALRCLPAFLMRSTFAFCLGLLSLIYLAFPVSCPAASPTVTYTNGTLSFNIPYHAPRAGSGDLLVELLNPEGTVLGRVARNFEVVKGDGTLQQFLIPNEKLPLQDLVWERVRYRFQYEGETQPAFEETKSISQILRRPVVHVLGQHTYLSGSKAAIRILVADAEGTMISGTSTVHIELLTDQPVASLLWEGKLNRRGTAEAQFQLPASLVGSYQLRYRVETPIGSAEATQPIQIEEKASILLTTEKPIYQPGQTIHVRALALDRADHKANSSRPLTFELEDSKGNKVFKKATETDAFGIASAEFALADEVNLGTYHLRALMELRVATDEGQAPSANTAEIALNVQRYVLPKFKVAIEFTEKDHKPRRDYRPGDHVTGTVHANYFFGKPLENVEIAIKASSMDVSLFEASKENGKTDKDGNYHFDLKLPTYFAGKPITQNAARVLIEATVKDSTEHSETRGEPITVSATSMLITAIPEGGSLIPKLDNQVFVLVSYPDGTPASAHLTVHIAGAADQHVVADKGGVAIVHLKAKTEQEKAHIDADDHIGDTASADLTLESRSGEDQILLRTQRAVYRSGERIEMDVFSTKERGTAYVDIVKDGQTIFTRDLDVEGGHATLAIPATAEMAGTLDFNAYLFGRDARPVGDHRLIFVQPADDLKIDTIADAPLYKPGAEARIHFHITNAHGEGVRAALGVQMVDEAVFALAEKQPGFAKVFFYLEQEAMKPRYEIHSLSMESVVEPMPIGAALEDRERAQEQRDRGAMALFAATEMTHSNQMQTSFGKSVPSEQYQAYLERYRAAHLKQVQGLAAELNTILAKHPAKEQSRADTFNDLEKLASNDRYRDAFGTAFRIQSVNWLRGKVRYYQVMSAGSDQQFGTSDDLISYIEVTSEGTSRPSSENGIQRAQSTSTLGVIIEEDRGPFNGKAQVSGTVMDLAGAVIPEAVIELQSSLTGRSLKAVANAAGQFTFASLEPARYSVIITSSGFMTLKEKLTVKARDLAQLSASLTVGAETQTVTVSASVAMPVPAPKVMMGRGAGAIGGVIGGVFKNKATAMDTVTINASQIAELSVEARDRNGPADNDAGASPAHVRSYFPEALYINPEIITNGNGDAEITVPIADSITTWRMALLASTENGALGTNTSSLKVFQDFFVDLDMPITLTQGDRVSIPVAIYNYSAAGGDVGLKLEPADWYSLVNDSADKTQAVESNHPGGAQFTLEAKRIGKFKLTLSAKLTGSEKREDIVVREIEVVPNGREQTLVFNGHLDSDVEHKINFPANAIPEASKVFVRLYPGPLSQVIEGMDSILRMPGGCFEQTSSSTYPNVLALDYMKRTKKLTPEVHAKAEGYIANGYQRLLTFEVPGGGFSWFGEAPANKILTAYGLMEFSDMAKVYEVDPKLIERTQQWLAQQQQPDGSWKPDSYFINEGATNRFNSDALRITAYLAWSLQNTGYKGEAVEKAKQYLAAHLEGKADAYTLAVLANFATEYGKDRDFTSRVMQQLLDARTETGDMVSWSAEETGVYSTGTSASIETTGLAAQALLKWAQAAPAVRKALNFISSKKDATGGWGTTQATIMALRAILRASEIGTSDVHGSVELMLNGKPVQSLQLTPENNDLLHQFVFKSADLAASNNVEIRFKGTGGLAYQVAGSYFVPWEEHPVPAEPLSINIAYDRTKLAQNDIATATATITSNLDKRANMVMVDIGIPPGFELQSEDLQDMQAKTAGLKSGHLEKFSLTATQAILYFDALSPHETVTLKFRLRAKYPIRTRTFESRVYEYYDPAVRAIARPVELVVESH